jgi:asparagine synthase (glutamine-hydrolysing)
MSVQFGRWNFDGQLSGSDYIEQVRGTLAPYGPDGDGAYRKNGLDILYHAFHTTRNSDREVQPHVSPSGAVVTWDGRLDNREELIKELPDASSGDRTDVAVVAAACEAWGIGSFAKLIGDWALSVWNPSNRSLLLAKDPIGQRHLYYSIHKDHVAWCSILDPLVLFAGKTLGICEEYVAGWLAHLYPAAHLTPYAGIHAVPPSGFVLLRPGEHTVREYWKFDPAKRIRYRADAEYEEHFRDVFAKAVQRRLCCERPVLAELSGGLDSASIVCVADTLIATQPTHVDTISWYNDSDPTQDERPYFTVVEDRRGRPGCHIDLTPLGDVPQEVTLESEFESESVAVTPFFSGNLPPFFAQYAAFVRSGGYRVTLSGIGGSEFLGDGVPTPTLEFQDLLVRAHLIKVVRQLDSWAAKMRKPRWFLLWEAIRAFLPFGSALLRQPSWFDPSFARRNRATVRDSISRTKFFGPLPSFQSNVARLEDTRRVLSYCSQRPQVLREIRYPFLDRDLLEFILAIPREQIVRVGTRRSLMKRALVGIVPDEILKRRRKAPTHQTNARDRRIAGPSLDVLGKHNLSSLLGIVNWNGFLQVLEKAKHNKETSTHLLSRTLELEVWLRHLSSYGILTSSSASKKTSEAALHPQVRESTQSSAS